MMLVPLLLGVGLPSEQPPQDLRPHGMGDAVTRLSGGSGNTTSSLALLRLQSTGVTAAQWEDYVLELYGAQREQLGRLPTIDEVDIIYDNLLPLSSVNTERLPGRCQQFEARPLRLGRAPHSPHAAWFYRNPPFQPKANNTWVEISHCGGSLFETHASWYYLATGSGIFVNVGTTISFAHNAEAVRYFLGADFCEVGCCGNAHDECDEQIHDRLPEAARAAGFRSIQFLRHCDLNCEDTSDETLHGCAHELLIIQTTADGSLGTGGAGSCPRGIELRTGVDGSQPCECVENIDANIEQLHSDRGSCAVCRGSPTLRAPPSPPSPPPSPPMPPLPPWSQMRLSTNPAICVEGTPLQVVNLALASDPYLRYFDLVEQIGSGTSARLIFAARGGAQNPIRSIEQINVQLVYEDASSQVIVDDPGFAANVVVRKFGSRYFAFGGEYTFPPEGDYRQAMENSSAWSDWPRRDGIHGLVADDLQTIQAGAWLTPDHGYHLDENNSWVVSHNQFLLDGRHAGRVDARGVNDTMAFDGKLSMVQKNGRWLLYARSNLRFAGGRFVAVARSRTAEPWGPSFPAYEPFQLIEIDGYDTNGPSNIYFFDVNQHPFDTGMLMALMPVNLGNATFDGTNPVNGQFIGEGNGDGEAFIGLSLGCDGVHWSRITRLVWSTGSQGRTLDHPVNGILMEDGEAHFFIHRHVQGISPLANESAILKYRFDSDALRELTLHARMHTIGCVRPS